MVVDGLQLLRHHVSGKATILRNRHVKGRLPFRVCDRTTDRKTRDTVEGIHAHHDSRSPSHLLAYSLGIEREDNQIPLSRNVSGHYQTSLPCGSPQSYSPSNASGALEATKSSIRCRPRTGRQSAAGVMLIRDPSADRSTIISVPISIPRESTIALGIRTPWLLPQRCKVVFMSGGYTLVYTSCKQIFYLKADVS